MQVRYEDSLHTVSVPRLNIPQCSECGELSFDNWADDQIRLALREQLQLLSPEQIRSNRVAVGLSPPEFASRLGVDEESVRRWEEECALQPRALDNLMRLYFELPPVRSALDGGPHPDLGARVVA